MSGQRCGGFKRFGAVITGVLLLGNSLWVLFDRMLMAAWNAREDLVTMFTLIWTLPRVRAYVSIERPFSFEVF